MTAASSVAPWSQVKLSNSLGFDDAALDEPTSHQDDGHVGLVLAALAAARSRGTAVLVATHDERVLATADSVVEPHAGAVVG